MHTVSAGAFKNTMTIKNIRLYKNDRWDHCLVMLYSSVIKCIFMDEIKKERPYYIEMYKSNDMVTLSCDGMIIYQKEGWFTYSLEFIERETDNEMPFYEEVIVDI